MKKILLFYIVLFLTSCSDCNYLKNSLKKAECLLIVEKKSSKYDTYFNHKGREPINGKPCECVGVDSYRWWNLYKEHIDIGDTVVKRKGELIFSIHKKDTVLNFEFICNE